MTTNQVRVKLGDIANRVFTVDFSRKFEMIASQMPDPVAIRTISDHEDNADAYINLVASHVNDQLALAQLAKIANPLVVFVVYQRYHIISRHLMEDDQNRERNVPKNSKEFVLKMLIELWKQLWDHGSSI